jgi:hypothetical protein
MAVIQRVTLRIQGEWDSDGRSAEDVAAERFREAQRYTRPHGEQPEPAPVSVVGCPYCQRVPCEDQVHALWRIGKSGSDV